MAEAKESSLLEKGGPFEDIITLDDEETIRPSSQRGEYHEIPQWNDHEDLGVEEIRALSRPYWRVKLREANAAALQILRVFLPSFLIPSKTPRKQYPTSYLDGLRGVAALFVAFGHYAIVFFPALLNGWHSGSEGTNTSVFQLPMIRIIHSGRFMVSVFFVISGFVLSYRSLTLSSRRQTEKLLESLSSSVFRRWLRLMLPAMAPTFMAFLLTRANVFHEPPPGWDQPSSPVAILRRLPAPVGSFWFQFLDWVDDARQLVDPFRYGMVYSSRYNIGVLGTIQIEFMGSMVVFLTVLGIACTRTFVKIGVLAILIAHCHYYARWNVFLFLSGILLAEISLIRDSRAKQAKSSLTEQIDTETRSEVTPKRVVIGTVWSFFFLIAIYLGSWPLYGADTAPGFRTLYSYVPAGHDAGQYYLDIGAVLLVTSLENFRFLQGIFTTRIAQFLGDISFSLYMLHCQIEWSLSAWLIPKCIKLTGGFATGMTIGLIVAALVTFWAADVFSRLVDVQCVEFARWVSKKCFVKD